MQLLRMKPMSAARLTREKGKPAMRSARNRMPTMPEKIMPMNGTDFDTMRTLQPGKRCGDPPQPTGFATGWGRRETPL